ncbi:MAG TPA: serine/threonine-protein kinase [Ktedonobacteraceae bacterium]|nr:serine/threonine-protein kinase [Ktedonobacteraceae bacterium]
MDQASSQPPDFPTIRISGSLAKGHLFMPDGRPRQLGNYRLLQLIAEGGFAEVYLGVHIHLNILAAIKVLHAQLDSNDLEEFRKEARIVARLRHPHIVSIHDFDVKDGTPFLVMDYAPNGTLRQRHPKGLALPPTVILPYIKQVADALQYAHDRRFIHRDIKPENMLIDEQGMILLSDFGIAVVISTHSQSDREIVGTIMYMAPEQLQGKPVMASDQYSLAIVVYEWLSGECPFKGSLGEVAAQHVNMTPPSLCARIPQLSPALEAVVMRALAKDPAQRFPSALDFAYAFEAAMHSQPLQLSSSGTNHLTPTGENNPYAPTILAKLPTVNALPVIPRHKERKAAISRRTVVLGLAGLAALGAAGGTATWLASKYRTIQKPAPTPTGIPTITPTPIPIGTTFHTYRGHHDIVLSVASSLNGQYIASASKDTTVQVWDTATGGVHAVGYSGHTDAVTSVSWSPDEQYVVSGSNDKTVRIWKTADASNAFTYMSHTAAVNAVAWSHAGTRIASGSADKTVQVWTAADGSSPFSYPGHMDVVWAVAWSPDSMRIASGSADKTVQVWNAADGSSPITFSRHSDVVYAVAWSPDGTYIASGGMDKTVRVWKPDVAGGTPVYTYGGHTDAVYGLAWSLDGTRIASASKDGTVQVWGATDGSNPYSYKGHGAAVDAVAWIPIPGTLVVSGSQDTTVQIWQGE